MALTATLGLKEGCTILSYDGTNTFNSIYRHRFLPAPAEIVPSVISYALNLYGQEPPKLVKDLAAFATLVFSNRVLPEGFWALHTSANPSALGQKARSVACGDVLRRVVGTVFCSWLGREGQLSNQDLFCCCCCCCCYIHIYIYFPVKDETSHNSTKTSTK